MRKRTMGECVADDFYVRNFVGQRNLWNCIGQVRQSIRVCLKVLNMSYLNFAGLDVEYLSSLQFLSR